MLKRYSYHKSLVKEDWLITPRGNRIKVTYSMVSDAYGRNPRLMIEIPQYPEMALEDITLDIYGGGGND